MNLHDAATAILSYSLQSGFLLVIGLLLPRLIRLRHPRTLLVYWRVLLIVALLLPMVPLDWARPPSLPYMTLEGLQIEAAVATALPDSFPVTSWRVIFAFATGVTLLGMLRLALGLGYLNSCRRYAQPLAPTPPPVTRLQEQLGLDVPFLVSNRLTAPLTYGWFNPTVLLPPSFRNLSADQQEGVACHELLHVRRNDWAVTFLEEVLRAILWFHPAVWLILPRIALSREQVVDTDTVRLTGKRRPYLDALWSVVCGDRQTVSVLAVPFLGRRDLVDRVAWLKKERKMSKTRIAFSVIALSVSLAAAGIVGAAISSSDSVSALSTSGQPAGEEKKKDTATGEERKLETVSSEAHCEEITDPVVIEKVNPKYPAELREEKLMGEVVVRTVITEEGLVDQIEVLESAHDLFSEASIDAIRQWRFEPSRCDGTPVGVYYNLTVRFRLQ